jgi:deoxycytidylate deaminase
VFRLISDRLRLFKYTAAEVKISRDILENFIKVGDLSSAARINALMDEGNRLRKKTDDFGILAKLAAGIISRGREVDHDKQTIKPSKRKAFVISSLKHPDEVQALRKIYSNGFFLIGVHADKNRRVKYLTDKGMGEEDAKLLVDRDEHEADEFGQHTRDTFHLSDFFINYDGDADKYHNEVVRALNLIFGHPFVTPTFDEFAMFMAFSASLRSADLSRQVGAVVTRNNNIVSTGANDVPKAGGGLYWAERSADGKNIVDTQDGRDFTRGFDANVKEKQRIIEDIVSKFDAEQQEQARKILGKSKLKDITEYGRVAHAEMEALLACARNGIPTVDAHLYCTTFPCHNCAKHIIAAGVQRVVYVEPYPKSKALEFHKDSITFEKSRDPKDQRVLFEPFVGVGPRSFFNLFSTNLGSGSKIERKDGNGEKVEWTEANAKVRMQMLPSSYVEREAISSKEARSKVEDL